MIKVTFMVDGNKYEFHLPSMEEVYKLKMLLEDLSDGKNDIELCTH